jgi:hypothetical protein
MLLRFLIKYGFANVGGQFRLDTSKLSRFGEFKIDERRGKMFSSEFKKLYMFQMDCKLN